MSAQPERVSIRAPGGLRKQLERDADLRHHTLTRRATGRTGNKKNAFILEYSPEPKVDFHSLYRQKLRKQR
jgi:hypothetical protein